LAYTLENIIKHCWIKSKISFKLPIEVSFDKSIESGNKSSIARMKPVPLRTLRVKLFYQCIGLDK
jgi:hypothetical protein